MKVNHEPNFDVGIVTEKYSTQDGVPVKYVCTTDLRASDVPVDVYYRKTPHPEFGNHYFGLYYDNYRGQAMICNADIIEELEFGMVKDKEGTFHYSQSHHDYKKLDNGKMIDGGRAYVRSSGGAVIMRVIKGKFVAKDVEDLVEYYQPGQDCQV
jgi:hypothetical protein